MIAPVLSTDYVQAAASIANANKITFSIDTQANLFLTETWSVLPNDELIGLVVAREGIASDKKHYLYQSPVWCWKTDNDYAAILENAAKANKSKHTVDGVGAVYWQPASRIQDIFTTPKRRGGLTELRYVGAFWCDIDCAAEGYTLDEAYDALFGLKMPPSIVIFSGGGLQATWLLSEPWAVTNQPSAEEFHAYAKELTAELWPKFGIKVDSSVQEASRMMRVPGFINTKKSRHGAVARIIYWNPALRYSPDTFRANLTLPVPEPRAPYVKPEVPGGVYPVTQSFIAYAIDGQRPNNRHPAINAMAWEAVATGMDMVEFREIIRPIVKPWFSGEGDHRWGSELDAQVEFIYKKFAYESSKPDFSTETGEWPIKIDGDHFVRALDVQVSKATAKTIIVERHPPPTISGEIPIVDFEVNGETVILDGPIVDDRNYETLENLRARQDKEIEIYLNSKHKAIATTMLIESPPGAGKTHAAFNAAAKIAVADYEAAKQADPSLFGYKGRVAFLTLFRFEKDDWRGYISSFGIDPELCFYMTARTSDSVSPGYCANIDIADKVAKRGYSVITTVCNICPFKAACEASGYLAQFPKAVSKPILITRHQHGKLGSIMDGRDIVVVDESPNANVAAPLVLGQAELHFKIFNMVEASDHPVHADLVKRLAEGFLHIWSVTKRPAKSTENNISYETAEHTQLQGRWFGRMLHWLDKGFPGSADILAKADSKIIKELCTPVITDLSPAAIDKIPQNWLYYAWELFSYEYKRFYLKGAKHWNSRIAFIADKMLIHPMEPYAFTRKTKVIITDATAAEWMYSKSFSDKQGRPRQTYTLKANLVPRAKIRQYTGTEITRAAIRYGGKSDINVEPDPVFGLNIDPGKQRKTKEKLDNATVAQAKRTIEDLVARHDGSLLVVTYKSFALDLRKWATKTGIIDPLQIQWFGGLAGKNDFKHLRAVLVLGTPRIPEVDLLLMAQVWYYDSDIVIDTSKKLRTLIYKHYTDPVDGKGRAYQYWGFTDDRVNDFYLHLVQGEILQCLARIREDVSDDDRTVYLGTAFPVTNRVDELISWVGQDLIEVVNATIEKYHAVGLGPVFKSDIVAEIEKMGRWSSAWILEAVEKAILARGGELALKAAKKSYADIVIEWLENNPTVAAATRKFGTKEWVSNRKLAILIGNISHASVAIGLNQYWLKHGTTKI